MVGKVCKDNLEKRIIQNIDLIEPRIKIKLWFIIIIIIYKS